MIQDSSSESELIRRAREGDSAAFAALINEHLRMVERIVARLIDDRADREEICQDVFIRVSKGLAGFRADVPLAVWIARIAHRTSVSALGRLKSRLRPVRLGSDDSNDAPSDEPGPEDRLEAKQVRSIVDRELSLLPPIQRTVVTLYHLQGMTIKEIGLALEMPGGTIKSHLFRARERMKNQLLQSYRKEELIP